jgi:hypothetical protein
MPHTKGAQLSAKFACESLLRFLEQKQTTILENGEFERLELGQEKTPLRLITPEGKERCFYAQGAVSLTGPLQYEVLDPKTLKFSLGSLLTNIGTFFQALFLALMCVAAMPEAGETGSFVLFNTIFFGIGTLFFVGLGILSVVRNHYPKMKPLKVSLYPTGWTPKRKAKQAIA